MTTSIEDRLREAAIRLDHACEQYTNAGTVDHTDRTARRAATLAASALGVAAIIGTTIVVTRGDQQKALAPEPTATVHPSTTTSGHPTTVGVHSSTPPPTFNPAHTPVSDSSGKHVGWVDTTTWNDIIVIPLPASYTTRHPHGTSAIEVAIVRDDAGQPVGLMSGLGFIPHGLTDGRHIDPAIEQRLIDYAIANDPSTTIASP
jgi:hypothetical protein